MFCSISVLPMADGDMSSLTHPAVMAEAAVFAEMVLPQANITSTSLHRMSLRTAAPVTVVQEVDV